MRPIKTDEFSEKLRSKAVRPTTRELLVSKIEDSSQEDDLMEPTNCGGIGRIRHFRRNTAEGWPTNSLPIDPASGRLGRKFTDVEKALVFQNAACNWRCWYCYVPFSLLSANEKTSRWVTAKNLVDLYLGLESRPVIIDLSGGQPDLVPEWTVWMMEALEDAGIQNEVFLWSDDNLSNDYFWRYLDADQIRKISGYKNYGKVGCFKGFDDQSFQFNTRAESALFDRQFELFGRSLELGIDLYGYATFTTEDPRDIPGKMNRFIDRLQILSPNLPLRVVPLEVQAFGTATKEGRISHQHELAMELQNEAIECWNLEISKRFTLEKRKLRIHEVAL